MINYTTITINRSRPNFKLMFMLNALLTTYPTWKLDTRLDYWNNDKFSKSTFKLPAAARHSTSVLHELPQLAHQLEPGSGSGECRSRSSEFCFTSSPTLYRNSIIIDVEFSAEESVLGTYDPRKVIWKLYICMYVVTF